MRVGIFPGMAPPHEPRFIERCHHVTKMEVAVGIRVVRGPDWTWGDQDGGEGHVGTVVEVDRSTTGGGGVEEVLVQWDHGGQRCRYSCGGGGKYDLRVFDSAPTGIRYPHKHCHACGAASIAGLLWKCIKCYDCNLCTACYMAGRHSTQHYFMRIENEDLTRRTQVTHRARARQQEAWGIFPGAEVVRGHDWRWEDQDGGCGNTGKVGSIKKWKNESSRSVAEVEWTASTAARKKNVYRVGHNGKMDLQCTNSGSFSGGWYYPDHLPTLGAPYVPPTEREFAAGDTVKVELDPEVWKMLQEGFGGWNDYMATFIDVTGTVHQVDESGRLLVNYLNNAIFNVNPEAVTKVNCPSLQIGDVICILDDMAEVMKLQRGHGEWSEDMELSLGQPGRVVKTLPGGDIQVAVCGRRWIYNNLCLKPAPGERPSEDQGNFPVNALTRAQLDTLMEKMNPELVPVAAAAGDATVIKEFLDRCPREVNAKAHGKSALHIAIAEGYTHVVKTLLQYRPNLDIEDDTGERPLHFCAHFNQDEGAQLLLDAGADVNCKNALGVVPISLAAMMGNCRVLKVLANSPQADLSTQDIESNTPLHLSVMRFKSESVAILLDAGADPTLFSPSCFTPILETARNGFYAGMEQFMARYPQHANAVKIDDGHTALHIAAANDHLDIVCLLASLDTCDLNAKNHLKELTPLHHASQRGFSRTVEYLVGYGADINATDSDGNSALHTVTVLKDMTAPSVHSPQLQEIEEQLTGLSGGTVVQPYVALACFLAREGGDLHLKNFLGTSPMQYCPQDVSALIFRFLENNRGKVFHGTLPRFTPPAPAIRVRQPRRQKTSKLDLQNTQAAQPTHSSLLKNSSRNLPKSESGAIDPSNLLGANASISTSTSTPQTPLGVELQSDSKTSTEDDGTTSPVLAETGDVEEQPEICVLCENPATVRFEPCGHVTMCKQCAGRAKRCPICRNPVESRCDV